MILVLSGTKDGRQIIERLLDKGFLVLATTATGYGGELINSHPNLVVYSKRLNGSEMKDLMIQKKIRCVVDATHPYAKEVSENAIKACQDREIPYMRYERKSIEYEGVKTFESYEDAIEYIKDGDGNILLTIGSNNLDIFSEKMHKEKLYIRILPTSSVIEKCEKLGFLPKQILGLQGPFTKALNMAIYKQYNIKYMVTKDSGVVGGTIEKIETAIENNIEVILIKRPRVSYENKFNDMHKLLIETEKIYTQFRHMKKIN